MRPVQLELTNFGPYRKEVINFTQFDHAPLFLIGGDTGAGKSTLFDAMTVSLFATTSGDRNVEEMRSTFASPEDDLTKVTFYFQQGNHLYRIERILQQERAKRGGGTTMQKATASLVIVDKIGGQEIEKLGDKIKEVMDACYLAKRVRDMLPKLPNGVTSSHIHYLDTIRALECSKNSVRVSDISDELGLPRPSVTKTIKDMEKLGFIEKKTTKEDGRVVFISITAAGKDLVDKYVDQCFSELSLEFADISDEDADHMIETIEKLYEVMSRRRYDE